MAFCKKVLFVFLLFMISYSCKEQKEQHLDISGEWIVRLDSLNLGLKEQWFSHKIDGQIINLPSTLDEVQIGKAHNLPLTLTNDVLSNLARKHSYIGKAWYEREVEIPENWANETVELKMERIIWQSTLFVNGQKVDSNNSLSAPHVYNIGQYLIPGKNRITVLIDNSDQYPLINVESDKYPDPVNREMAHAYTNHTQIKWNGILGDMLITKVDALLPEDLKISYQLNEDQIGIKFKKPAIDVDQVPFRILDASGKKELFKGTLRLNEIDKTWVSASIKRPNNVELWDEFHPNLYVLEIGSETHHLHTKFGLREISNKEGKLLLNGNPIFLRGNLECSIFPLTGRPPLEKDGWLELYKQAKAYGLNHLRFHSWCPPAAAFEAADEVGLYLQAELPHWSLKVGEDESTTSYLQSEAMEILNQYGNHASFIMMSLGNELQGDIPTLKKMTDELKQYDTRRLYATTTFSFQRPVGTVPQKEDDFFVTQWTDRGWIRGQGIFNDKAPHFNANFSNKIEHIDVPVISHEIGQYSVYPDLSEIEKYTGVLDPVNFKAIKKDLQNKDLLMQAADFTKASGKLAAILYKEEIERAMKTPEFDGFQLLQLQDFPGQGTALVGLLNAFWESKGVISGEEFRQFNSEVVPLIQYEKAVYEEGELFKAAIQVANYHKVYKDVTLELSISDRSGNTILEEKIEVQNLALGLSPLLGNIEFEIKSKQSEQYTISVSMSDTNYRNSWNFWSFPKTARIDSDELVYTREIAEASEALQQGKKVLFNPTLDRIHGVEGRFVPVFWSPVHFPDQPSTMGLLMDPDHHAFDEFVTSYHTDWQWWDICKQSISVDISDFNVKPIVQVVDNFVTNRKLANVFEAKIGNGQLIFTSIDLDTNIENRPAARQLRSSLMEYMQSNNFNPEQDFDFEKIRKILAD